MSAAFCDLRQTGTLNTAPRRAFTHTPRFLRPIFILWVFQSSFMHLNGACPSVPSKSPSSRVSLSARSWDPAAPGVPRPCRGAHRELQNLSSTGLRWDPQNQGVVSAPRSGPPGKVSLGEQGDFGPKSSVRANRASLRAQPLPAPPGTARLGSKAAILPGISLT